MKSIQINKFGGPEVLVIRDEELGSPGPKEVLIKNLSIGLNFIDIYHRTGLYPIPLPSGIGLEACVVDIKRAAELDKILQPLHSSLFIESNPSPVKYAASLLGMCKPTVRLPLVEIRDETKKKVSQALKVAKLL